MWRGPTNLNDSEPISNPSQMTIGTTWRKSSLISGANRMSNGGPYNVHESFGRGAFSRLHVNSSGSSTFSSNFNPGGSRRRNAEWKVWMQETRATENMALEGWDPGLYQRSLLTDEPISIIEPFQSLDPMLLRYPQYEVARRRRPPSKV